MKIVKFEGKTYRIIRKSEAGGIKSVVADFLAQTKKNNYGWKPVKNFTIKAKLRKKFYKN